MHFQIADLELKELIATEISYIENLRDVAECYYTYMMEGKKEKREDGVMTMPHELAEGKDRIVFGNIIPIYTYHRE